MNTLNLIIGEEAEAILKYFDTIKWCYFIMIPALISLLLAFVIAINDGTMQILIPPLPNFDSSKLSTMDSAVCYTCILYFSMCKDLFNNFDVSIAIIISIRFLGRNYYLKWRIEPTSSFFNWCKQQMDQKRKYAKIAKRIKNADTVIHISSHTQ